MKSTVTTAIILIATVSLPPLAGMSRANDIGYVETFALATNRTEALGELIPGTEDYYFYHCLHYQHLGQWDAHDAMLTQWIRRHRSSPRIDEIRNRQALLRYDTTPDASLNHIRDRLGLLFNHQKIPLEANVELPTQLAPALISRETLTREAMRREPNTTLGFADSALEFLITSDLNPDQRRHLLQRLQRPDYANLVDLVDADLRYPQSGGFGSIDIHSALLLPQLEDLLKRMPDLIANANLVNTYLTKLQPNPDVDWAGDREATDNYLKDLSAFTDRLPPAFNSLKAHVGYHRLLFNRRQGHYDRDLFMAYLKLPRQTAYMLPEYLRQREFLGNLASLTVNYQAQTQLPPVQDDEAMVRDYLLHFLKDAPGMPPFDTYIQSNYLKALLAEAKMLAGIGDPEQWFSLLPPEQVQSLRERVDIDLLPTNPEIYTADAPVTIDVAIKNVSRLLVKTFEINADHFYRKHGKEIETSIDLDGLVAGVESQLAYTLPPIRRHEEKIALPHIAKPGIYVVELIGNGVSSRALIRKGSLRHTERLGAGGHVFTIHDAAGKRLKDARLWIAGRDYAPDAEGDIRVPFSTRPGRQTMILSHAGFSQLATFDHKAEEYRFTARMHAEREALTPGTTGRIILRPELTLQGNRVDLGLIEDVTLELLTTDVQGIASSQLLKDLKLDNNGALVHEFQTPRDIVALQATLRGRIRNVSKDADEDLTHSQLLGLNAIHQTDKTESLYLRKTPQGFRLELLGKTGEPRTDRALQLTLQHRDFVQPVETSLKTDAKGGATLGPLPDITQLAVVGPQGIRQSWPLFEDTAAGPSEIHALEGDTILVPFMRAPTAAIADAASLLEVRGGVFINDRRNHAAITDGYLVLSNLPAGDYDLWNKPDGRQLTLRVTAGRRDRRQLIARDRILEEQVARPLQITLDNPSGKTLTFHLQQAPAETRVHIVATRYVPSTSLLDSLQAPTLPSPANTLWSRPQSLYLSGRNIGDEFRYVLERKQTATFPGNMLKRPSLLLTPWSLRKTEMGSDEAAGGEGWDAITMKGIYGSRSAGERGSALGHHGGGMSDTTAFSTYDFLPTPSVVLANLTPGTNGILTVERTALGGGRYLQVYTSHPAGAVYRQFALEPAGETPADLRLAQPLDPQGHFSEQKRVDLIRKGETFTLNDIRTSELKLFDNLSKVHGLLLTLTDNATLRDFSFILDWPKLSTGERLKHYTKNACHELNFFLYQKDPTFFREVVRPYLVNKKDKTFLDHWLLEDDLTAYQPPAAYQRLNIAERILLTRRSAAAEAAATQQHVVDLADLIPFDQDAFTRRFDTALASGVLSGDDSLGLDSSRANLMAQEKSARRGRTIATGGDEGVMAAMAPSASASFSPQPESAPMDAPAADMLAEAEAPEPIDVEDFRRLPPSELAGEMAADRESRKEARRLYRKLDPTEEWAENNYHHVPIEQQTAALIPVNGFWRDVAAHDGKHPFISAHVAEATNSFAEMMFALALLDLPFAAEPHKTGFDKSRMTLVPGSDSIAFNKQIGPVPDAKDAGAILVTQDFFASDDRYRHEGNERFDKFVTEEFIAGRVYGCRVVMTNPSSARRRVDVLLQIPEGALPVMKGFFTRSLHRRLEPYTTESIEYFFYFPTAGRFAHYPVTVSEAAALLGAAPPFSFKVLDKPSRQDTESWEYLSQYASNKDVLRYMEANNIQRLNLNLIAFRMRDPGFYRDALRLLDKRRLYHDTLWSYSVFQKDVADMRTYLPNTLLARTSGAYLRSPLLDIDPLDQARYQHKEYWPLVNARVFQLGRKRRILNAAFYEQYHAFLDGLKYRPELDAHEQFVTTIYLFLQDRVEEALTRLAAIDPKGLHEDLQYDYLRAYAAFYRAQPDAARAIAAAYTNHPVARWRNLFTDVVAQSDEISGAAARITDADDRDQQQALLADTAPALELEVAGSDLKLSTRNLASVTLRFYLMDLELLFSRRPFVQDLGDQFAIVQPNRVVEVALEAGKPRLTLPIPAELAGRNVMIEAAAAGLARSAPYYPNALTVQMMENDGQLRVTSADASSKPLSGVYVKVYARMGNGTVAFYKDGYTDLRGRFDYTSLNTSEIDSVERFALLIMSDSHGALTREAAPPNM